MVKIALGACLALLILSLSVSPAVLDEPLVPEYDATEICDEMKLIRDAREFAYWMQEKPQELHPWILGCIWERVR